MENNYLKKLLIKEYSSLIGKNGLKNNQIEFIQNINIEKMLKMLGKILRQINQIM